MNSMIRTRPHRKPRGEANNQNLTQRESKADVEGVIDLSKSKREVRRPKPYARLADQRGEQSKLRNEMSVGKRKYEVKNSSTS